MDMYGALFAKAMGGGGGSNVVPNPEGEATETLNKIGIDETIYGMPKELPEVTSADEGDVLAVNASGEWAKAVPSGGGDALVIYATQSDLNNRITWGNGIKNQDILSIIRETNKPVFVVALLNSENNYRRIYVCSENGSAGALFTSTTRDATFTYYRYFYIPNNSVEYVTASSKQVNDPA